MKQAEYHFHARLYPSLALGVACLCLARLGVWQWSRYQDKLAYVETQKAMVHQAPQAVDTLDWSHLEALKLKPVTAQGRLLTPHILVEHSQCQQKMGFQVFTPLQLPSNGIILLDRGLIATAETPKLATPDGQLIKLQGHLNVIPQRFELKDMPWQASAAQLTVPTLVRKKLEHLFGPHFYPYLIQVNPTDPHVFTFCPSPLGMSPHKHLGYAIQWFAMAIMSLIYYVSISLKRIPPCQDRQPTPPNPSSSC